LFAIVLGFGALLGTFILLAIVYEDLDEIFLMLAPFVLFFFCAITCFCCSNRRRKANNKAVTDMYEKVDDKIAEINDSFEGRGVRWRLKPSSGLTGRLGHTHIEIEISNPRDPTRGTAQVPMGFPPAMMPPQQHFPWLTPIASAPSVPTIVNKSFEENRSPSDETSDCAPLLPPTKDATITD